VDADAFVVSPDLARFLSCPFAIGTDLVDGAAPGDLSNAGSTPKRKTLAERWQVRRLRPKPPTRWPSQP
jgi:hypothetical protein